MLGCKGRDWVTPNPLYRSNRQPFREGLHISLDKRNAAAAHNRSEVIQTYIQVWRQIVRLVQRRLYEFKALIQKYASAISTSNSGEPAYGTWSLFVAFADSSAAFLWDALLPFALLVVLPYGFLLQVIKISTKKSLHQQNLCQFWLDTMIMFRSPYFAQSGAF